MHEYSIVAALIDRVSREVEGRKGVVSRLSVQIGEVSGVEIPLLKRAYDTFRQQTLCERAELAIEAVAADWRCPKCHRRIPNGTMLRCSTCQKPARLMAGGEIVLERIELEVPNV